MISNTIDTLLSRSETATKPTFPTQAKTSMGTPPRRVLLVDDDEAILETVRCALLDRGYQVVVARDGAEALACAERDAPDLILLDLVMPKRSGLTVLDRLSRQPGAPPVIMMTANEAQKQRDFAISRGVTAYISKPFEMEHLLSEVEAALQAQPTKR